MSPVKKKKVSKKKRYKNPAKRLDSLCRDSIQFGVEDSCGHEEKGGTSKEEKAIRYLGSGSLGQTESVTYQITFVAHATQEKTETKEEEALIGACISGRRFCYVTRAPRRLALQPGLQPPMAPKSSQECEVTRWLRRSVLYNHSLCGG